VNHLVIISLFLLLFLGLADNQMIAALLPGVIGSWGIKVGVAGLMVVAYSGAAAVAAFLAGTLSDRYGRRPFLQGGILLFALASLLAFRSDTFLELVGARALTGLGAGTISACALAFAGDWFPYAVRGWAISLISCAYFAAPIIGVPLAAQVADRFGWRHTFLLLALSALVAVLLCWMLPAEKAVLRPEVNVRSALATFRSFLARRDTSAALTIAFLVSGGMVGFLTYIGQWLSSQFGVATGTIGWLFMFGGLAALLSAPLGGRVSDRWGKRPVSIAASALLAIFLASVPLASWGVWLLAAFGLISLSVAFRQGPLMALMTALVSSAERGAFIGFHNIASQLGIGVTVFATGFLYQRYGYAAVTTMCALMTALAAVLLTTHIIEPQA